jgi:hypothetical protein
MGGTWVVPMANPTEENICLLYCHDSVPVVSALLLGRVGVLRQHEGDVMTISAFRLDKGGGVTFVESDGPLPSHVNGTWCEFYTQPPCGVLSYFICSSAGWCLHFGVGESD